MRSVPVVVPHELAQHRPKVPLIQEHQVVEARSAKCPDHSLRDIICRWRVNRRGDGVDASGASAEVAVREGISIAQQMPRCASPGVASMNWRHTQAAVGSAVTFRCTNSRRPWAMNTGTYSVLRSVWAQSAARVIRSQPRGRPGCPTG